MILLIKWVALGVNKLLGRYDDKNILPIITAETLLGEIRVCSSNDLTAASIPLLTADVVGFLTESRIPLFVQVRPSGSAQNNTASVFVPDITQLIVYFKTVAAMTSYLRHPPQYDS